MDRTIIEPFAEFTLSSPVHIRSLSLSPASDKQSTLFYVGTSTGSVLLVSTDPSSPKPNGSYSPGSGPPPIGVAHILGSAAVGPAPVDAIHVLGEIGRLLVLSNGLLFLLDLLLLQPVQKVGIVKGVTAVCKRLRFGESASSDPLSDVALWNESSKPGQRFLQRLGSGMRANGARAKASEAYRDGEGNTCFVGVATAAKGLILMELLQNGIVDVNVSVASKEIHGFNGVKAMEWLNDSILVGTAEGYVLLDTGTGRSTIIFSLPESSQPPQLKSLCQSKEMLLLVDNVGVVVNANGQPVGGSLVFRCAPDHIAEIPHYVITLEGGAMRLYRKNTGICVQLVKFSKNGDDSLAVVCDDWECGEKIICATLTKVICFHKASVEEQIKDLLRKKYFKEAIHLVEELESDGEMTKEMTSFVHAQVGFLLLFDLHFEDAVDHFLLSETMQPSEIFPFIMQDPNRWSPLVPRNRYWGLHPPPILLEQVVDDGLMAIQRALFLKRAGVDISMDENFLLNPPSKADLLETAIRNIKRYFQVCRGKDLSSSVKQGVDTFLMYLYRALNCIDDMEQLASSDNSCVVEELETLLDDSGHLRTLAFLYAGKGMSSKALAIWQTMARNYATGLWKDLAVMVQLSLQDVSKSFISAQKAAAIEASKLLEESSDQGLILLHLGWIADEDPELAVRILTSGKRLNQLTPGEVLTTIGATKTEIRQRYLQWLIENEGSDNSQIHTMYAISLAKSAIEAGEASNTDRKSSHRSLNINNVENRQISVCSLREKLQLFLKSSDLYDPDEILDLIGESELWLEKAILYKKLGEESLVLGILALKLEDSEAAEQYCAEIGREEAYMQLLDMYLDPQNGKEPMIDAAVRLLHSHGECLDPMQVLEKLTPDMPLQLASNTLLRMLRARVHHYRQGQIVRNISQAINLECQMAKLEERSRHVQINDESTCSSCHTRLGTKLLAMYPDDSVICYKCYRRLGESTSVNGRNFKENIMFKPGWLVIRNPESE